MIEHINKSYNIPLALNEPTIIYEDNIECIAQIIGGYMKGIKYIFYEFSLHL